MITRPSSPRFPVLARNITPRYGLARVHRPSLGVVPQPDFSGRIIAVDTPNYNVATVLGNPAAAVFVRIKVGASVNAYGNATGPGIDCSGLPSGSTVVLYNYGTVWGKGGNGGVTNGAVPVAGGDAIKLAAGVTLFVFNFGFIYAGGGGGGQGNSQIVGPGLCNPGTGVGGGSGGGGGRGFAGGTGGAGATSASPGGTCGTVNAHGQPGINGSASAPGNGGSVGSCNYQDQPGASTCGSCLTLFGIGGATGGDVGVAGGNSSVAGAAAGKAINLNGGTATFYFGNDAVRVKGAVS